jgi:hypothetical protein
MQGGVPLSAEFAPGPAGLGLRLHLASLAEVDVTGAVPKAVTLHDLQIGRTDRGSFCAVTIDV